MAKVRHFLENLLYAFFDFAIIINAYYYTFCARLPTFRSRDPCPPSSSRLPAEEAERHAVPSPLSRKTEEDYPCLKTKF